MRADLLILAVGALISAFGQRKCLRRPGTHLLPHRAASACGYLAWVSLGCPMTWWPQSKIEEPSGTNGMRDTIEYRLAFALGGNDGRGTRSVIKKDGKAGWA
jgi:hypothetical protein